MSAQPLDPLSEILAEERFNQMRRLTLHSRMLRHAPEMFELLKQANSHISCLDDRMYKPSILEDIEDLIQKIEGEK